MQLNETLSESTEQVLPLEEQEFDYTLLDIENRIFVQKRTGEIKNLIKRNAQDIIDIGQKLIEVKQRLGHGNFEVWLKVEFDWSEWTARKFIQLARKFKSVDFTDLSIATSALYLFASSSTPEAACKEALERASQGEAISYTAAKDIVTRHKKAAKPKASKADTVDIPIETVAKDLTSPSEPYLESQTVESQSATIIEDSQYKLHENFQLKNISQDATSDTDSRNYSFKNQSEINIQSLFLINNLIYLTYQDQQESKLLGQISEIKELNATDVVIRVTLEPFIDL